MLNLGLSEIFLLVIALIYGYLNPENEEKNKLVKIAVKYWAVLGVLLGILMKKLNIIPWGCALADKFC